MIGTTLNQRFTLDQELGRGGMGTVFRATDLLLQRPVAIKVLKDLSGDEVGRRLRLEAQITARLVHEHIVRLYDFGEADQTSYFIMELVDGSSLQRRWRSLTLAERLRIVAQAAEALDYAHRQGVVHRDVKPGNILLTAHNQPKLSDFGLSLLVESAAEEEGHVRGTPHYMSPEQARGLRVDHRTDLYALGVLLYECGTGRPPFQGSVLEIIHHHIRTAPVRPRLRNPELSPAFEELVLQLLSKAPGDRPAAARAVAEAIRTLPEWGAAPAAVVLDSEPAAGSRPATAETRAALPAAPIPSAPTPGATRFGPADVARMLAAVEAEPIALRPEERYLAGHYLAYLLGGSRRRGILLRRPLDPINADRARLLLAMTYLMTVGADDEALGRAAALLDARPDIRPRLHPGIVMRYLASRDTPRKRKEFRAVRERLRQLSHHAQKAMLDPRGLLNPGLMPQVLDDLWKLAPSRTEVDDQLVARWNRVAEVWRANPVFRDSVLRYATLRAFRDPASAELWPEVVYPLIERARWQRHLRSRAEAAWDALGAGLGLPDAGVRLDRAFRAAVPAPLAERVESALQAFVEEPSLEERPVSDPELGAALKLRAERRPASFQDLIESEQAAGLIRLAHAEPSRHTMAELRALWQEAITALRTRRTSPAAPSRSIPIGPYRLAVVPSIRARAAGQVVLQGMPNKQIELLVPSFTGGGPGARVVLAVWTYENLSVVLTYIDHRGQQGYVCWDAATNQQLNFEAADDLNHALFRIGMEVPDQLDRVLTKRYRPHRPV